MTFSKIKMFRIAAANWEMQSAKNFESFYQHLEEFVKQAAHNKVNILVLPEYFSIELLAAFKECPEEQVPEVLSVFFPKIKRTLRELSVKHNIIIVGGSTFRQHKGLIKNSSITTFPSGKFLTYDKQNLVTYEQDVWAINSDNVKGNLFKGNDFSVQICFDIEFPEITKLQVYNGSSIICVPSYTHSIHGFHRVRWSCHARTVEYQSFVAQACLIGEMSEFDLNGYGSAAIMSPPVEPLPGSGILMESSLNTEGLAIADVNLTDLDFARKYGEVKNWAINMKAHKKEIFFNSALTLISKQNIESALMLGDACFELEEDRQAMHTIVDNYVSGKHSYKSPYTGKSINLLPHTMISKRNRCLAIGGLYYYDEEPLTAWLSWLAVTPEQQRNGIGTSIVQNLINIATDCGMKNVSVLAAQSETASAFYLSNGFVRSGDIEFLGKSLPRFVYSV